MCIRDRPCDADALATSSYEMYFVPQPLSDETFVRAAVVVVLPWSTWPMVPTFTCGLVRSNFALAMPLSIPARRKNQSSKSDEHASSDLSVAAFPAAAAGPSLCAPITRLLVQHLTIEPAALRARDRD